MTVISRVLPQPSPLRTVCTAHALHLGSTLVQTPVACQVPVEPNRGFLFCYLFFFGFFLPVFARCFVLLFSLFCDFTDFCFVVYSFFWLLFILFFFYLVPPPSFSLLFFIFLYLAFSVLHIRGWVIISKTLRFPSRGDAGRRGHSCEKPSH